MTECGAEGGRTQPSPRVWPVVEGNWAASAPDDSATWPRWCPAATAAYRCVAGAAAAGMAKDGALAEPASARPGQGCPSLEALARVDPRPWLPCRLPRFLWGRMGGVWGGAWRGRCVARRVTVPAGATRTRPAAARRACVARDSQTLHPATGNPQVTSRLSNVNRVTVAFN